MTAGMTFEQAWDLVSRRALVEVELRNGRSTHGDAVSIDDSVLVLEDADCESEAIVIEDVASWDEVDAYTDSPTEETP